MGKKKRTPSDENIIFQDYDTVYDEAQFDDPQFPEKDYSGAESDAKASDEGGYNIMDYEMDYEDSEFDDPDDLPRSGPSRTLITLRIIWAVAVAAALLVFVLQAVGIFRRGSVGNDQPADTPVDISTPSASEAPSFTPDGGSPVGSNEPQITDETSASPTDTPKASETPAVPTAAPTQGVTAAPTSRPTSSPTSRPTASPSAEPTDGPTDGPTEGPTEEPTGEPTEGPSEEPTDGPTEEPTEEPTGGPTEEPTEEPTDGPSEEPTEEPTGEPTEEPTGEQVF